MSGAGAVPLAAQYAALRARAAAGAPTDFEALLRRFHGALLRPGDIAIDLGAYGGTHALAMARGVGPDGAVHAFEPNPAMAAALRERLARDGPAWVTLHEAAAGLADGEADYVLALDSPGYSGLRAREYDRKDMRTATIRVRTARLDTALGHLPRLAFIKADVEGGEFHALQGGAGLIERLRPAISFEFGVRSYGVYGVDPAEVFAWFVQRRYVLFDIIGNRLPTAERFLRSDGIPGLWDYLAVPEERGAWRRLARGDAATG